MGGGGGGFLNVTWQSPLLVRQRRRRTKQEIDDLFLYWGQTTFSESVSLNPVSAGALHTRTQWRHRQDKHTTLKQVIWREAVPLVIPIADALPQEGLLMWNSHYLMRNFTLISWTDQSAQSGYASLDKVQDILQVGIPASLLLGFTTTIQFSFYNRKFPLGLNPVAGGFEVSVLTGPITVWQPLVRVHRMHITDIVTSVEWKKTPHKLFELLLAQ